MTLTKQSVETVFSFTATLRELDESEQEDQEDFDQELEVIDDLDEEDFGEFGQDGEWDYYYEYMDADEMVAGDFLSGEYINTLHAGTESENDWHFVYIYPWDGDLWWDNDAGFFWQLEYDAETEELTTGEGCPFGQGLVIEITEAWDSSRGDVFKTLTFNGEPYTEYDHYEWYDYQFGEHDDNTELHYE